MAFHSTFQDSHCSFNRQKYNQNHNIKTIVPNSLWRFNLTELAVRSGFILYLEYFSWSFEPYTPVVIQLSAVCPIALYIRLKYPAAPTWNAAWCMEREWSWLLCSSRYSRLRQAVRASPGILWILFLSRCSNIRLRGRP